MFEHRRDPLLSKSEFIGRIGRAFALTGGIVLISVGGGVAGFVLLAGQPWHEAFHTTCMLLAGRETASPGEGWGAQVFGGIFALYAHLVFFSMVAILSAPILHRILHKLHLDEDDGANS